MSKLAGKRSVQSVLAVLAALFIIACSEERPTQTYEKDDVHLELPEGWEVFEDRISKPGIRTVSVVTAIGSTVTVDVFHDTGELEPAVNDYLAAYLRAVLQDEEAQEKASIDWGESTQGGENGMFMDVTLAPPFSTRFFVEVYPKTAANAVAYIAFNTPTDKLDQIHPHIDRFVRTARIGEQQGGNSASKD